MDNKEFTPKQVLILILAVVVAIAFMETSAGAIWTWTFWRVFLLKIIIYGTISEFVVILLSNYLSKE